MMNIEELSKFLKVKRGTLSRKICEHNKANPGDQVKPDKVEDGGHYKKYFYSKETAKRIGSIIAPKKGAGV